MSLQKPGILPTTTSQEDHKRYTRLVDALSIKMSSMAQSNSCFYLRYKRIRFAHKLCQTCQSISAHRSRMK